MTTRRICLVLLSLACSSRDDGASARLAKRDAADSAAGSQSHPPDIRGRVRSVFRVTDYKGQQWEVDGLRLQCYPYANYSGFSPKDVDKLEFEYGDRVSRVISVPLAELREFMQTWRPREGSREGPGSPTAIREYRIRTANGSEYSLRDDDVNFCGLLSYDGPSAEFAGQRLYTDYGFVGQIKEGRLRIPLYEIRSIEPVSPDIP